MLWLEGGGKRRQGDASGSMQCLDESRNNDLVPALHLLSLEKTDLSSGGYRQEASKQKTEWNWERKAGSGEREGIMR